VLGTVHAGGAGPWRLARRRPSRGAAQDDGMSTLLMMYTVALAVCTLPQTTLAPLTV
jgi:hypothetical protein